MGLTHLLDTNICIGILRRRAPAALLRLQRMSAGTVGISAITISELECGAAKSTQPARNREALAQFLQTFEILDYHAAAASHYGEIRSHLEKAGTPIGPLDTLIAAHARSLNAILVTNNLGEFRRVPGLKVEDWQ